MRIDTIKIKNFKGFTDTSFRLNPRFTVFIGDNATGKTSVLDALAVAAGSFLLGIDVAEGENRVINHKEIRLKTVDGEPRPQIPVEIEVFGKVNGIELTSGWKRTVNRMGKNPKTTTGSADKIKAIATEMVKQNRENGKITFPVIAYHGTGRLWAEHREKKPPYKKQTEGIGSAYIQCLSPKSSSKEFLSWYKTFEDEVGKFGNKSEKKLLNTFNHAIITMLPDDNWTDISYSFKDEDLIGHFKYEKTFDRLLFSQLSDGYRNLIGMVADIAYRCIKLNPHLGEDAVSQTPGIVLIDELDLHLHPNWQKGIVANLKKVFNQIQFVATTHSPFIVQSLMADELINLDAVKGLDNHPNKYSLEEISQDEMGVKELKRSNDFIEMQKRAESYFELIKKETTQEDIDQAKRLLDDIRIQFIKDPAYVALLESELPKKKR
jgi:predicted ATP-binding protein involved in virulence